MIRTFEHIDIFSIQQVVILSDKNHLSVFVNILASSQKSVEMIIIFVTQRVHEQTLYIRRFTKEPQQRLTTDLRLF